MMQWFCQHPVYNELKYICFRSYYIMMAQHKTVVTPFLMHWSYCSLAPSHQYILAVRFSPYTIGHFSWLYFLPITSKIFTKPIMATHWSLKKMVEIMQTGFGKCKYFKFKQTFIWIHFWGVHQWSCHWFKQWLWTNKETSHWLIGNWEIMMLL